MPNSHMSFGIFSAAHQSRFQGQDGRVPPLIKRSPRPNWTRARSDSSSATGHRFDFEHAEKEELARERRREARDHMIENDARESMSPSPMANAASPKTYSWISLWFLLTVPVIAWDVGFCFMRPRSFFGGDLHWLWKPYAIYQNVDYVYGLAHYESGSGFTNAQSLLNVVETVLNVVYLYLAHVSAWPSASLVGFSSALMTLAKTVLYWLQEYYCSYCAVGHNSLRDAIVFWIIPNGLWIVIPALIVRRLGKDLIGQLDAGAKASRTFADGKMQ